MTSDLGWLSELNPPANTTTLSRMHRLIVHDYPEDGFDVLHPDDCESEITEWGDGIRSISWSCDVAWHIDSVGCDPYWNAFDEAPPYLFGAQQFSALLPGIYVCWVQTDLYKSWDAIGGYEYESYLFVEPQKAITTGPNMVERIGAYISEMRARYKLSGSTRWFLALCIDCQPLTPMPFRDESERDAWASAHTRGTDHMVERDEAWY